MEKWPKCVKTIQSCTYARTALDNLLKLTEINERKNYNKKQLVEDICKTVSRKKSLQEICKNTPQSPWRHSNVAYTALASFHDHITHLSQSVMLTSWPKQCMNRKVNGCRKENSSEVSLAWCTTPRLVSSSADGLMLTAAVISCSAANVSPICRFTIARPSRAGTNSVEKMQFQQQLYQRLCSSVTITIWITKKLSQRIS